MATDTSVLAEMLAKRRYCKACGQPIKWVPDMGNVHVGRVDVQGVQIGAWLLCPGTGEPKPDVAA